jgi:hypothetical protein
MSKDNESKIITKPPNQSGALVLLGLFAVVLLLVVGLFVLSLKLFAPEPTVEPGVLQQAAASTLEVAVPIYVDETLKAMLPGIVSGTLSALPTNPTPPPIPTEAPIPCDQAGFVTDQTIPDGTKLPASTAFTKVWIVRNLGSCTWAEDYALVFSGGELMAGKSPLTIGRQLAPGDVMEISANLVTPGTSGLYSGYWMLQNSSGNTFGLTPDGEPLSFFITVGAHESTPLDFTKTACQAAWTSTTGKLKCPETEDITGGAVNPVDFAIGEAGIEFSLPVLEVIPNEGPGGKVSGTYGLLQIQNGDSFHATIACADNQPDCALKFELQYDSGEHNIQSLGSWLESTDGVHHKVIVDLSPLVGRTIRLILSVSSQNSTANDNKGLWIAPVILRTVI